MPVFRLDKESSKCRNVFLSNLCEKDPSKPMTLSHNQGMLAGPCLNRKMSTAVIQLRFDDFVLCFDLKKAFLQIELPPSDQSKLLFYWYRNVSKKDYSLVVFKHIRLPFGLRCSPALLLLGLYKILILDTEGDDREIRDLKKSIYDLCYMDNCALSYSEPKKLEWAFHQLKAIFEPYGFELQQFITNYGPLSSKLNIEEMSPTSTKLFGLLWDTNSDCLSTQKLCLNSKASTKREILGSIASNFDLYNFCGPILNRARIFMHNLQCRKDLDWDTRLSPEVINEWKNISKQVNSSPSIYVNRCVGNRVDKYKLIMFTDSSKTIYGCVLFLFNLRTKSLHFLQAKNRFVNKQLSSKSIPTLEFQAISLGVEILMQVRDELSGSANVNPIKIVGMELYSDSLVCLHWLASHVNKFGKLRNLSIFVKNRLENIVKLCEEYPVSFHFCEGHENPADPITRSLSYKQLQKSNYLSGPDWYDSTNKQCGDLEVIIPNPLISSEDMPLEHDSCQLHIVADSDDLRQSHLFSLESCSKFTFVIGVYRRILQFVNVLKIRLRNKFPTRFSHFKVLDERELILEANRSAIRNDQKEHFPEIFSYYSHKSKRVKDMPNLISQLNVFLDENGILRVKSKVNRWKDKEKYTLAPILLARESRLTRLVILHMHIKNSHAGVYSVLSELRKTFWIPKYFSVVKKELRKCVNCRRFNRRTVKLNQSPYRDFRLDPPNIPYRSIFLDYLGPYYVKINNVKTKVWLLCITCLWSRAINLKICIDLTVPTFLRAFQLHVWEYGFPKNCFSDMGTQIIAGTNIISDFLGDVQTKQYLQENNINAIQFQQYYKGCNELGSLVEACVKLVKRLFGSIKNYVLDYFAFEFHIFQVIHLVNRRRIAFKESLRETNNEIVPSAITPEILLKGYEFISLNVIPNLQSIPDLDPTWKPDKF